MPRVCSVCTHPDREAIDKALVANTAIPRITALYRVSEDALLRHKAKHLPAVLARAERRQQQTHAAVLADQMEAQEGREEAHARDVREELERCFVRVNLLFDACDRWLRDAEDPTRYDIGPRADDISVTYSEMGAGGKLVRRKASLAVLLRRLEADGAQVERWETKYADPRDLVLKTASQLTAQAQLLAKLLGELQQEGTINIVAVPEWLAIRAALLHALAPFPDARQAAAAALRGIEAPLSPPAQPPRVARA